MTNEELVQLAEKIKAGNGSPEERDLFFSEFSTLIDNLQGDLDKLNQ